MVTLNQSYIAPHSLVEKGTVYETMFLKAIDELKKSEELRKKMSKKVKATSGAKATLEKELAKIKAENVELQSQLQGNQEDLQTIQCNYANVWGKVMGLKKKVKPIEERLSEATSREVVILEAKQ